MDYIPGLLHTDDRDFKYSMNAGYPHPHKKPFRCRIGWHKWENGWYTVSDVDMVFYQYHCVLCGQWKEERRK